MTDPKSFLIDLNDKTTHDMYSAVHAEYMPYACNNQTDKINAILRKLDPWIDPLAKVYFWLYLTTGLDKTFSWRANLSYRMREYAACYLNSQDLKDFMFRIE